HLVLVKSTGVQIKLVDDIYIGRVLRWTQIHVNGVAVHAARTLDIAVVGGKLHAPLWTVRVFVRAHRPLGVLDSYRHAVDVGTAFLVVPGDRLGWRRVRIRLGAGFLDTFLDLGSGSLGLGYLRGNLLKLHPTALCPYEFSSVPASFAGLRPH